MVDNFETHLTRYEENLSDYDPFRKRVVQGLAHGLTKGGVDLEQDLYD